MWNSFLPCRFRNEFISYNQWMNKSMNKTTPKEYGIMLANNRHKKNNRGKK